MQLSNSNGGFALESISLSVVTPPMDEVKTWNDILFLTKESFYNYSVKSL